MTLKMKLLLSVLPSPEQRYTGGATAERSSYNLPLVFHLRKSKSHSIFYSISVISCLRVTMFKKAVIEKRDSKKSSSATS